MTNRPHGALVLVVEDEVQLARFLRTALTSSGHRVIEAGTAAEARRLLTANNPDVVLLDLGLPDADGLEFTREIRGFATTPIIVISARGREEDKVEALDLGADDYLTKPFAVNELLARIRVALRHASSGSARGAVPVLSCGPIRVDLDRHEVEVGDREVHLTPIEFKLLVLFLRNVGKVLTHRFILKEVWGAAYTSHSHYVRVHMAELRKKIEENAAQPRWLLTEPGVGYRLREDERRPTP